MPITGGGGGGDTLTTYFNTYYPYLTLGPVGSSDFVATISGFTAVAGEVGYNVPSSGDADYLTYYDTINQIGRLVLHNTTRGNNGEVFNHNAGTRVITLKDEVPGDWAINDTITLRSQTCTVGAAPYWFDLYLGDFVPADATAIFLASACRATVAGGYWGVHPFSAYSSGKAFTISILVANLNGSFTLPVPMTDQKICIAAYTAGANQINSLMYKVQGWWA